MPLAILYTRFPMDTILLHTYHLNSLYNMDMNIIPIFELYVDEEKEVQGELFPEDVSVYDDKEWDVEEFKENKNRWQLFQDKSSMSIELRDIIDDKDRT